MGLALTLSLLSRDLKVLNHVEQSIEVGLQVEADVKAAHF